MQRRVGTFAAALAAVLMAAAFVAAPRAAQNDRWGASYFPNLTLTTQDGAAVRFYDDLIKGKIVAINLIYTSCKYACPLETARLAQVYRLLGDRMGRDVFFYSITIDPEHDTPQVLKEYAKTFDAGPGWLFLTGRGEDIELISRKIGLYSQPDASSPDGHTPHLLVGNEKTGQWMRNSGVDNPKFLATTISTWLNSWQTSARPSRSYADAPKLNFARGEYEFTNHCGACHSIGGGDRIGPDLKGVTAARDHAWLDRFIREPEQVRAGGDAIARTLSDRYKPAVMPRLGLSPADVSDLLDYIEQKSARSSETPAPPRPVAARTVTGAATGEPSIDLRAIVDPYIRIQRALNVDSLDGAAANAREMAAQAAKLGPPADAIRSAAGAMGRAAGIGDVRTAFGRVSDEIIAFARQHRADLGPDVNAAYCPMVRKYWLQRGDAIVNPFYGQSMSGCGRLAPDRIPAAAPASTKARESSPEKLSPLPLKVK